MLRRAILAAALVLGLSAPAFAQLAPLPTQPADTPWPTAQWTTAPLPADANAAALNAAVDDAFAGYHALYGETRAVVIVQGGRIVFERYYTGYNQDTRLISWSMAKSITQALVGAAVLEGKVDIDQPMGNPNWRANDPRQQMSWRPWLNMVDGDQWSEMQATGVVDNDSARMLFGPGRLDNARYAASMPRIHAPGTHWNYNSGGSALISDALTRAIVPDPRDAADRRTRMRAWMNSALFDRIGMRPMVQFDPTGLYYGSSQIYATARDYARFGLLYLRGGVWDGQRVLPEGWVDFARAYGPDGDIYGAHWWLTPQHGRGAPLRALITDNALSDAFSAQGHEGQIILVVPSKDLVVVRLGRFEDNDERWDALGDWMGDVARAFGDRAG